MILAGKSLGARFAMRRRLRHAHRARSHGGKRCRGNEASTHPTPKMPATHGGFARNRRARPGRKFDRPILRASGAEIQQSTASLTL
jgi:hypothetical protein